ncbi:MAG: flagellar basal body rod protein FlgB [Lachnospiraceae bacterium]
MFSSGAFGYVDVLKKAADAKWQRNEILTNNIANVDTPGFKRSDLEFETYLAAAIQSGGTPSSTLSQRVKNADLSKAITRVYEDHSGYSYRLDGNNVDIETENVELASNQLEYQALIDSLNNEFDRIKTAIGKN